MTEGNYWEQASHRPKTEFIRDIKIEVHIDVVIVQS